MQVSFWEYSWASSVGVLPGMAFFIYLGSLAHNLLDIGSKQPALNSTAAVVTIVLSGVMITLVAALTGAQLLAVIHQLLRRSLVRFVNDRCSEQSARRPLHA